MLSPVKLADTPSPSARTADLAVALAAVESALGAVCPDLVPERVPAGRLEQVMALLGRIERRAGGARLVLARAAADAGGWRAAGARSPEEHLARQAGTSLGEAKADLKASERLAQQPRARAAAAGGELSKDKTRAVADGAAADPAEEGPLLQAAAKEDLGAVRDRARRARHRAEERSGRAALRRHQRRALRAWVEVDGEGRGSWNVPPGYQAAWLAALEPYRQEAFRVAREAGRRETPEALMADAMQLLCLDVLADHDLDAPPGTFDPACPEGPSIGEDPPPRPSKAERRFAERRREGGNRKAPAQVVVHASYEALARGHVAKGEMCEVPGVGPVPVSFARALAINAVLRVVLTRGADVASISSQRRYVPAPVRAALAARDRTCVVPGCSGRHHLQIHHWRRDFAAGGPTEIDNLARLCLFHHALVTHCGWVLSGGPGSWSFAQPP